MNELANNYALWLTAEKTSLVWQEAQKSKTIVDIKYLQRLKELAMTGSFEAHTHTHTLREADISSGQNALHWEKNPASTSPHTQDSKWIWKLFFSQFASV